MIPVFFHIPKCAGTYIFNRIFAVCSILGLNDHKEFNRYTIKTCEVLKNGEIAYRIIVRDVKNQCPDLSSFKPVEGDDFSYRVDFNDWLKQKHHFEIWGLCVQDISFSDFEDERTDVLNEEKDLYYLTCLRDSYDRAISVFSYLSSSQSKHENTHEKFGDISFEEYLNSEHLEDCWVIRVFNNIPDSAVITDDDFYKTINILSTMHVFNMGNVDESLKSIFKICYNVNIDDYLSHGTYLNVVKNETKEKINAPFLSLKPDTRKNFLKRTEFDRKLYNYFEDVNIS